MILLSRSAKKWKALAAKLKRKNDELADMVDCMLKKGGTLRRFLIVGDTLRADIDHPAMSWLMYYVANFFKDSRVMNYVILDYVHPEVGTMTVTIQKASGKTPINVMNEQKLEIERQKLEIERHRNRIAAILRELQRVDDSVGFRRLTKEQAYGELSQAVAEAIAAVD